jgi:peptidoglycan-N-acetylglucosamine deacetylase
LNKIALSFDVEDWYHGPMITGSSYARYKTYEEFFSEWKEGYDTITDAMSRVLNILNDFQIKATFFLVADIVAKYPVLVNELKSSGHEIACHSLNHYTTIHAKTKEKLKSDESFRNELLKAKNILESYFEQEIIGYRAPGAYFAAWMVAILKEAGFCYDSSVAYNSIYNKTDKELINIPTSPYYLAMETLGPGSSESEFIELPWSYCRVYGKYILPAGGGYFFRVLGISYFKHVLKKCLSDGDTMFYLHPIDISTVPIPMENFKARPFFWINKGKKTEKKLLALLNEFKGNMTTCKDVYQRFHSSHGRKNF